MTLKLFWCTTPCGEEDYFVVATSAALAIAYFAREHDFDLGAISAEELFAVPEEDRPLLDPIIEDASDLPRTPPPAALAHWGIFFNENFHVFYDGQRIFRPEGLVREHMRMRQHRKPLRAAQ